MYWEGGSVEGVHVLRHLRVEMSVDAYMKNEANHRINEGGKRLVVYFK